MNERSVQQLSARSMARICRRCRNFSGLCKTFSMSLMPDLGKGRACLKAKLIDMSVEGSIILGFCRQRPTETIYEATAGAYRGLKMLRKPTTDTPVEKQQHSTEGRSRFR
jgi:hypothetical protein